MLRRPVVPFVLFACLALLSAACGDGDEAVEVGANVPEATALPGTSSSTSTTAEPEEPALFPYLGTVASDADAVTRRAVVIKVDNDPNARPQVGLSQADLVFEAEVEGITRLAAIFHSRDADAVGPIRSARTSDLDILASLAGPLFAFSGANGHVTGEVRGAHDAGMLYDLSHDSAADQYWRETTRIAPYNLFASTNALRERADRDPSPAVVQLSSTSDADDATDTDDGVLEPFPIFDYRADGERLRSQAVEASGVVVRYQGDGRLGDVEFVWDEDRAGWVRHQHDFRHGGVDAVHRDAAGEVIAPANVVVMYTQYVVNPATGSPQALSVDTQPLVVLTDGHAIEGEWTRGHPTEPFQLQTADGDVIKLTPGPAWVLMPQVGGVDYLTPERAADLLAAN